jgi:hypothetical protein
LVFIDVRAQFEALLPFLRSAIYVSVICHDVLQSVGVCDLFRASVRQVLCSRDPSPVNERLYHAYHHLTLHFQSMRQCPKLAE